MNREWTVVLCDPSPQTKRHPVGNPAHTTLDQQILNPKTKQNKQKLRIRPRPKKVVVAALAKTAKPRVTKVVTKTPVPAKQPYVFTPCGFDYFRALANPFDLNMNPCIPGMFPSPSHKLKVITRGTFRLGMGGYGGIAMYPFRGCSSQLMSQVVGAETRVWPFLIATNETYGYNDYEFTNQIYQLTSRTDLTMYPGSTSVYDNAGLASNFQGGASSRSVKLVAAGLRVQYCDKVLDMSGDYITWRNPNPTAVLPQSQDAASDLLRVNAADMRRVGDKFVAVSYRPLLEADVTAVDFPYDRVIGDYTSAFNTKTCQRLAGGVFVANGQPGHRYAFEAVAYYEVLGTSVPTTPSHSDPHSLGIIISSDTNRINPDAVANERDQWRELSDTARELGYSGVQALGNLAGRAMGNALATATTSAARGLARMIERRHRGQ